MVCGGACRTPHRVRHCVSLGRLSSNGRDRPGLHRCNHGPGPAGLHSVGGRCRYRAVGWAPGPSGLGTFGVGDRTCVELRILGASMARAVHDARISPSRHPGGGRRSSRLDGHRDSRECWNRSRLLPGPPPFNPARLTSRDPERLHPWRPARDAFRHGSPCNWPYDLDDYIG